MIFALTTRWNASRHTDGEAMLTEILDMGFTHVELGYDLRLDLVPGVKKLITQGTVKVDSLHNFCPVPVGAPRGHPELFTMADLNPRIRESAINHTLKTVRFAAEVGARVVVVHAGNVEMNRMSAELGTMFERGEQFSPAYEKAKLKLQVTREKKVRKHMEALQQSLERLLPAAAETGVRVALEVLPTWEALPTEFEMESLAKQFEAQHLMYWHDIGHSQIRQNLGFISQERWLEKLQPWTAGLHIHDVAPPTLDHLMPPQGQVDFARLARFAQGNVLRVIEPSPQTPRENIIEGLRVLRQAWQPRAPEQSANASKDGYSL